MPEENRFLLEELPDYKIAHFKCFGKLNISQRMTNIEIVNKFCSDRGINHVLVDLREQINLGSTLELYNFGKFIAERMNNLLIAVVYNEKNDITFLKNVAINRGAAIATFNDVEKAMNWLKNKLNNSNDVRDDHHKHFRD